MSITPRRLGKYELQERLGRGGMAEVWKALDTQLQRYVAIKLLQANLREDPNFVTRFTREAQVVASLRHPNIVQIHDFYSSENSAMGSPGSEAIAYMIMEYIPGPTLADYVRSTSRQGRIPPAEDIIRLFTPISLAIDYAHRRGMIHRDIKPANILLDSRNTTHNAAGEPMLTDFGLAKVLGIAGQTLTNSVMGTPLYISPEQVQNAPVSPQTDLYALGVMLYEIFTGTPPFRGESVTGIMMQHLTATPADPSKMNPTLPPQLSNVLLKSMAKNPQERYSSAATMIADVAATFNLSLPDDLKRALSRSGSTNLSTDQTIIPTSAADKTPSSPENRGVNPGRDKSAQKPPASPDSATVVTQYSAPEMMQTAQVHYQDMPVSSSDSAGNLNEQVNSDAGLGANAQDVGARGGSARPSTDQRPAGIHGSTPPPLLKPAPVQSPPTASKRRAIIIASLIILLVVILAGSGLGAFFVFNHHSPTTTVTTGTTVGQAIFISTGQVNETTNEGSNDELQITLRNIPNPTPNTNYYAWLLPDLNQSEEPPVFLGALTVNHGAINFLYKGDSTHTNLLAVTSRFLITEESSEATPIVPSPDLSKWRYYAEIPQTPVQGQTYTLLDHLRHLLASDPELGPYHLPGGLDIWTYRNTQKVMQFAGAAQKDWNAQNYTAARQQIIGALDYLDGIKFVGQDVPAGTPITANTTFAQIGLLELHAGQNPNGYLYHIQLHLTGVVSSPGATRAQHQLAAQIDTAITTMQGWLEKVRSDAMELEHMDDAHLAQSSSSSILNDMVTQATYAFMGHNNPSSGNQEGFSQIYTDIQHMATFEVMPYKS